MERFKNNLKADFTGGISAAIIALPLAMGFGVSIFAPLGPDYSATGALAGMYGAIFTGIFAALFGGTPSQITGPTGPMSVVLSATVASLMKFQLEIGNEINIPLILTLTFFAVCMGGLVQILIGLLRAGSAIKFIPYPVIAGFMNGIAVIIFLGQIETFFGITDGKFFESFSLIWLINSSNKLILLVGTMTVGIIILSGKLVKKVPSALVGLLLGSFCYFTLGHFFNDNLLQFKNNPFIIGAIPSGFPLPKNIHEFSLILKEIDISMLKILIPASLSLGILGSIDSLLTSLVADVETKTRHNSNQELIGQGIGNIVASLFGGVSGAGATVRTLVNVKSGGRTKISGIIHGLFLLAVLLFLGPFAGWIPMSVLAGILIVTSYNMINSWSLKLVSKKTAKKDFFVVIVVTTVTVVVDLMVAVAIGFFVATALLLYELIQQSVVYKKYRCSHFRSRVRRSPEEDKILEEHGNKILVYELGGNLFFGTTDKLLSEVESEIKEKDMVIIDLKHVRHIDITGAKIIHQITNSIKAVGGEVYISSLKERASDEKINVQQYLKDLDVIQAFDKSQIFDNLNFALEKAEESLLDKQNIRKENNDEITLQISPLFCRLSDNEFQVIKPYFKHLNFSAGQKVFSKGETSNCLYVIVKGKVAIEATGGEKEKTRLSTFTQGSFFGETAVINKNYRETDALAIEKTSLLALESSDLEIIENEQKSIANKILLGLILNLSEHLRVTNESLIKLESV